ncbi:MAG: hypothetical protein CFE23_16290 [Flavobacterium sp. BFFFF1]|nr:MAG: hypothetical protein CFE23_16290 [Flavobacterium sp. BFFFF1]
MNNLRAVPSMKIPTAIYANSAFAFFSKSLFIFEQMNVQNHRNRITISISKFRSMRNFLDFIKILNRTILFIKLRSH